MDLIDRQAAIEAIRHIEEVYVSNLPTLIDKASVQTELMMLPSAQPERKKGKCVWCSSPYRIEYYWIDRDGNTASFQDKERHFIATGIANYCPNCGADMRGEQE